MSCINEQVNQVAVKNTFMQVLLKNINAKNIGLVLAGWSKDIHLKDYYYSNKCWWYNEMWDEKRRQSLFYR